MLNHFILYSLSLALGAIWVLWKPQFLSYTLSLVITTLVAFLYPTMMMSEDVSDLRKLLMTGGGFFLLFVCFAYGKMAAEESSTEPLDSQPDNNL
jgi:hypothetical protein